MTDDSEPARLEQLKTWTVKNLRDVDRYYDPQDRDLERDRAERARPLRRAGPSRIAPIAKRPEVLRVWLEAEAALAGHSLEDLISSVRRGRMSPAMRERYDQLASMVARLRARGATLTAIAGALGRGGPQTVSNLETRGRVLALVAEPRPEPCRRHEIFRADCPACLRNAPQEAIEYRGPEHLRGMAVGGLSNN